MRSRIGHVLWLLLPALASPAWAQAPAEERRQDQRTLGSLIDEAPRPEQPPARVQVSEAVDVTHPAPPPRKAIDEARSLVRDLFRKEIEAAKTPAQQSDLARTLLRQAHSATSDPAGHFALLEESAALAATAGDVVTAFTALDRLAESFQVNEVEFKRDALEKLAGTLPPGAHKQLADLALSLVDQAVALDDFASAKALVKIGGTSARKSKDAAASKLAATRTIEVEKLAKQYAVVREAEITLKAEPNDPDANLETGTYYCFTKGNWARGLPMLCKGSDEALKSLAEKDMAGPNDPAAQVSLADAWWNLAEAREGTPQSHLKGRAGEWYRKALPNLGGLAKAKAEKRLGEASAEIGKGAAAGPVLPLFAKAQKVVKDGKTRLVAPHGFNIGRTWEDIPAEGGVLTGLDVGLHPQNGSIVSLRAVYATPRGEVRGKPIGVASPLVTSVRSKPGYAIGAMAIRGGLNVDTLSVTFMQMQGDHLNPEENYKSDKIGAQGGRDAEETSAAGNPIVGLHGHLHRDGRIASIGIVSPAADAPDEKR